MIQDLSSLTLPLTAAQTAAIHRAASRARALAIAGAATAIFNRLRRVMGQDRPNSAGFALPVQTD